MKAWDLGGSAQFRSEWGRYTRGCDVIVFLVDTNDVRCHGCFRPALSPSDLVAATVHSRVRVVISLGRRGCGYSAAGVVAGGACRHAVGEWVSGWVRGGCNAASTATTP